MEQNASGLSQPPTWSLPAWAASAALQGLALPRKEPIKGSGEVKGPVHWVRVRLERIRSFIPKCCLGRSLVTACPPLFLSVSLGLSNLSSEKLLAFIHTYQGRGRPTVHRSVQIPAESPARLHDSGSRPFPLSNSEFLLHFLGTFPICCFLEFVKFLHEVLAEPL